MDEIYAMHVLHGHVEAAPEIPQIEAPEAEPHRHPHKPGCWCEKMELAQAYVREQPLEGVFPPAEGLMMGTVFPNLSKPYVGRMR